MDDLTPFDRQIAAEFLRDAGPAEPVDDLAIFEAVTAANRSHRWGFTMYSALKFIAAAAIVALFGAFLLAGVLITRQEDEMAPAAVTASPGPGITYVPTDDAAVRKVVSEPHREWLTSPDQVTIDADGLPWSWQPDFGGGDGGRIARLGEPGYEVVPGLRSIADFAVTHDGTLWLTTRSGVSSYDGESWTRHETRGRTLDLHIGDDGTVWAAEWYGLHSFDGRDWTELGDEAVFDPTRFQPLDLTVTPDGAVWVAGDDGFREGDAGGLYRSDGEGFDAVVPRAWEDSPATAAVASGRDGTLWALVFTPSTEPEGDTLPEERATVPYLTRLEGGAWTVFSTADGLPQVGNTERWPDGVGNGDRLVVGPYGRVWLAGSDEPEGFTGVVAFDGATWTRYLEGEPVTDLAVGPDGSIWAASPAGVDWADGALYVITPEAVAATE